MPKNTSIRLDNESAETLEYLARIDGVSMSEEIREAIQLLAQRRRASAEFVAKAERLLTFARGE